MLSTGNGTTDLALATAVDAANSRVYPRVTIQWPAGASPPPTPLPLSVIQSVTVERDLAGDLPDEVTLTEGYSTAKATIIVGQPVASQLHRWRRGSGLYGQPLVNIPVTIEWDTPVTLAEVGSTHRPLTVTRLPSLVGRIRSVVVDDQAGTATIECLDLDTTLDVDVSLPQSGTVFDLFTGAVSFTPNYVPGVIATVLGKAGYRVTPRPRTGTAQSTRIDLPLVGGYLPVVGSLGYLVTTAREPATVAPSALFPSSCPITVPFVQFEMRPDGWTSSYIGQGQSWVIEFWARYNFAPTGDTTFTLYAEGVGAGTAGSASEAAIEVRLFGSGTNSGRLSGTVASNVAASAAQLGPVPTGTVTDSAGNSWCYCAIRLAQSATGVVTMTLQSGTAASTFTPGTFASTGGAVRGVRLSATMRHPVQALVVTSYDASLVTPGLGPSSVPTPDAVLDLGEEAITALPVTHNVSARSVIRELARSEFGVAGFDESGIFRWRRRSTIQAAATDTRVINPNRHGGLSHTESLDSVRTVVSASITPRSIVDTVRGKPIFQPETVWAVPNGGTSFLAGTDDGVMRVYGTGVALDAGELTRWGSLGAVTGTSGFVACTDSTGATRLTASDSQLGCLLDKIDASTLRFTFRNSTGSTYYVVWPSEWNTGAPFGLTTGAPGLLLYGWKAADGKPVAQSITGDTSVFGRRTLALNDNPWRQRLPSTVLSQIVADLQQPRPTLPGATIPLDPRIQLTDVHSIYHPAGHGMANGVVDPIRGRVVGLTHRWDQNSATTDLTYRALTFPT